MNYSGTRKPGVTVKKRTHFTHMKKLFSNKGDGKIDIGNSMPKGFFQGSKQNAAQNKHLLCSAA